MTNEWIIAYVYYINPNNRAEMIEKIKLYAKNILSEKIEKIQTLLNQTDTEPAITIQSNT